MTTIDFTDDELNMLDDVLGEAIERKMDGEVTITTREVARLNKLKQRVQSHI